MKIQPQHLQAIEDKKAAWLAAKGFTLDQAQALALQEADANPKTKDRACYARWLLARAAGVLQDARLIDDLYTYAHDEHLNTAFKRVWGV